MRQARGCSSSPRKGLGDGLRDFFTDRLYTSRGCSRRSTWRALRWQLHSGASVVPPLLSLMSPPPLGLATTARPLSHWFSDAAVPSACLVAVAVSARSGAFPLYRSGRMIVGLMGRSADDHRVLAWNCAVYQHARGAAVSMCSMIYIRCYIAATGSIDRQEALDRS